MAVKNAAILREVQVAAGELIIGIDPSVTATGHCVGSVHEDGEVEWDAKVVRHAKGLKGMARVYNTCFQIALSVGGHQPAVAIMEGYAFSRGKVGRVFDLAETGMAIKLVVLRRDIPIIVVPPTTLKQFATGKGNAGKPEVAAAIQRNWGIGFTDDNKADAFALMLYGQYLFGMLDSDSLENPQAKALQKAELIMPGPFKDF